MQEDDENVEVWYLMAVAFTALQPPDYESARCESQTQFELPSNCPKYFMTQTARDAFPTRCCSGCCDIVASCWGVIVDLLWVPTPASVAK